MIGKTFDLGFRGKLMKPIKLLFLVVVVWFSNDAVASPKGRTTVDFVYELGEARLKLAETVLRTAAAFWAANGEVEYYEGHSAFRNLLGEDSDFRSLLAIDRNGQLKFDSFNPVPFAPAKDLSDRQYFIAGTNVEPMSMNLTAPVIGRQSGEYLIPATMAVPSMARGGKSIIMLVVPPSALLPNVETCSLCGVVVFNETGVLASSRPMSDVNEIALSKLDFRGEYGADSVEIRGMPVLFHWRRSARTGVVYAYYEADPKILEF